MKNAQIHDFGVSAGLFLKENSFQGAPWELPEENSAREPGHSKTIKMTQNI